MPEGQNSPESLILDKDYNVQNQLIKLSIKDQRVLELKHKFPKLACSLFTSLPHTHTDYL